MINNSETGLDVLKKARVFILLGFSSTLFIIITYHNFFSEQLSKIEFFGVLLISFFLFATITRAKSRKIKYKISKMEEIKHIKNPHEIVEFLNKSNDPESAQLKKNLISIYYESSFVLGFSIPFVLSMFTYFMKG